MELQLTLDVLQWKTLTHITVHIVFWLLTCSSRREDWVPPLWFYLLPLSLLFQNLGELCYRHHRFKVCHVFNPSWAYRPVYHRNKPKGWGWEGISSKKMYQKMARTSENTPNCIFFFWVMLILR